MLRMLKDIHEEIKQERAGKKPLNGDDFATAETILSIAVNKYYTKAVETLAPLKKDAL
ncbi:MAG: hypothetical protein V1661_00415 [bacterium]